MASSACFSEVNTVFTVHWLVLCDLHIPDAAADGGAQILQNACCSEISTDQVRTGLYCVSCSSLKQQLMAAADSTAAQLLDLIRAAARESNDRICETYTQMTNDLSKVSQILPAVLAALHFMLVLPSISNPSRAGGEHPSAGSFVFC